ncbi:MAG: cysteine hydrolase [Acidobacteriota bacterium]|nr:cysteine hydrolase [Acidobacteriota bacterium]
MTKSNTRHRSAVALVLVDVISDFDFPDGARLLRNAMPMAPKLARVKQRAREAGIPVIYVNDNLGQWRSEASKLVEFCLAPKSAGREFVELLRPDKEDYFVLKPMHSAFFQTPLETLLRYLGAHTLVLCGLATNSCVICTAHDADMRDFRVVVPSDCCAARTGQEHVEAIRHMKEMANAKVVSSSSLRFDQLRRSSLRQR